MIKLEEIALARLYYLMWTNGNFVTQDKLVTMSGLVPHKSEGKEIPWQELTPDMCPQYTEDLQRMSAGAVVLCPQSIVGVEDLDVHHIIQGSKLNHSLICMYVKQATSTRKFVVYKDTVPRFFITDLNWTQNLLRKYSIHRLKLWNEVALPAKHEDEIGHTLFAAPKDWNEWDVADFLTNAKCNTPVLRDVVRKQNFDLLQDALVSLDSELPAKLEVVLERLTSYRPKFADDLFAGKNAGGFLISDSKK